MAAEWSSLSDRSEKVRIQIPEQCHVGEIIEIRTLIKHVMETGNRKDSSGKSIPRNIIKSLKILFDEKSIFHAEFGSGISENPFVAFCMKVTGPGKISFLWEDEHGTQWRKEVPFNVLN